MIKAETGMKHQIRVFVTMYENTIYDCANRQPKKKTSQIYQGRQLQHQCCN